MFSYIIIKLEHKALQLLPLCLLPDPCGSFPFAGLSSSITSSEWPPGHISKSSASFTPYPCAILFLGFITSYGYFSGRHCSARPLLSHLLLCPQDLEQCLAYGRCSVNIGGINRWAIKCNFV